MAAPRLRPGREGPEGGGGAGPGGAGEAGRAAAVPWRPVPRWRGSAGVVLSVRRRWALPGRVGGGPPRFE